MLVVGTGDTAAGSRRSRLDWGEGRGSTPRWSGRFLGRKTTILAPDSVVNTWACIYPRERSHVFTKTCLWLVMWPYCQLPPPQKGPNAPQGTGEQPQPPRDETADPVTSWVNQMQYPEREASREGCSLASFLRRSRTGRPEGTEGCPRLAGAGGSG